MSDYAGAYNETKSDLAAGSTWDVDPDVGTNTGAVELHSIVHGTDCEVRFLMDKDNDGTYETDVLIDSFTGAGISQGNEIELYRSYPTLLRIKNTGSSAADFAVTGREVRL